MKTADAATLALLNATGEVKILRADLYTFTLRNGSVYRFTDADINLLIGANTFISGPNITRTKTKQTVGITIDVVQVTIVDSGSTTINGKPIIHQFRHGVFRGATVKIQKLYLSSWTDLSPAPVDWFEGTVGAPSCDDMSVNFEVKSMMEMLNKQMPADIYQDTCNNDLYDEVCGAVRASFTFNCTAGTVTDRKRFVLSGTSQADTYFVFGKVRFTSGQNAGQPARTVKKYLSGIIEVFQPFPYDIAPGDTCVAEAGCDKLPVSCGPAKLNRLATGFQATPYIPVPETAVEGGGVGGSAPASGSTGTAVVGSARTANRAKGTYSP
jgi:uncharacterized phage protein (TIGR02218 family)